ncbi:MAG: M10 family metallopeptidase C-terminal domain-containing protein [Hyphomicrobiaceae bacterium]
MQDLSEMALMQPEGFPSSAAAKPNGTISQGAVDTVPGSIASTFSVSVGSSQSGVINVLGDQDWFRVDLVAGQKYAFTLTASGASALTDPFLRLLDGGGTELTFDDDGAGNYNSRIVYTATATGTYFLGATGFDGINGTATGSYTLAAAIYVAPPVYTLDQIADQLTHQYWGGQPRFFVDADKIITVNLNNLTAEGAALARAALQRWDDVSSLSFQEVSSGAQITFDDNQDDAFANSTFSGTTLLSSTVNIGLNWLSAYGTTTDSYSFQTYVHEIGHALGLGHAGNYDGNATYGVNNHYANDSWAYSVMSYFDQAEAGLGSSRHLATVSMADIVAIQNLYGADASTRTGNTVYGHNATAGAVFAFGSYNTVPAFTIYDTGGTDTLDVSGYSDAQSISLVAESFSSVGGLNNNIAIARGTVVENVEGGSGGDTIVGNSVANVLNGNNGADNIDGGGGNDTLNGGAGADQLRGGEGDDTIIWDAGDDLANVLGGGGTDTLSVTGDAPVTFNLAAHGFEAAHVVRPDVGNTQPWSQLIEDYVTGWVLLRQHRTADDGTAQLTRYELPQVEAWDYSIEYFDALGRVTGNYVHGDDGTSYGTVLDTAGTQSYAYYVNYLDNLNRQTSLFFQQDDGSSYGTSYDVAVTNAWSSSSSYANAAGQITTVQTRNDDGTLISVSYDPTNIQTWTTLTDYIDAQGRQTAQGAVYDNGTSIAAYFDYLNVQPWTYEAFVFNAQGQQTGHYFV